MTDSEQSAASEAGRQLAAQRRKITVTCLLPECGLVFEATTAGRRKRQFCSPAHQIKHWRRRKREEAGQTDAATSIE